MRTLVLLPGLDGTGLLFADFVAALGPDVKTIVATYPSDTPLGYAELEPIARSFLPLGQAFYLLAESFSGPIAISIAATSPPGLLGVILSCSFARPPLPMPALIKPLLRAIPVAAIPPALLCFFVLGRFASPALRQTLARSLTLVAPEVLRARARAALSVDVSALLPKIEVPLLYLRAAEDRVVPESSSELIASRVPDANVVVFQAPHFLLQVAPALAAASVTDFFRSKLADRN